MSELRFLYRATDTQGSLYKGARDAPNQKELERALRALGLELIACRPITPSRFRLTKAGPNLAARAVFCRQMQELLQAGLPLLTALETLAQTMEAGGTHDLLQDLAKRLSEGEALSAAFAGHKALFGPVFLAVLAAGEASGDLSRTFGRLADMTAQEAKARAQLLRAVRYPLFLLVLALSVTSFMMLLVVPEIVRFLRTLGIALPLATRILIGSANFFAHAALPGALVLLGGSLALALARALSRDAVLATDRALLGLPGFGAVLRRAALARFAGSLALLCQSGVALPNALETATSSLSHPALEALAAQARHALLAGEPLSSAAAALFPPLALQRLRVGEVSANLPAALQALAESAARESQDSIDLFIGGLEPTLTLLIGGLLAWIVLAVLGPVYGSLGALAQGGML